MASVTGSDALDDGLCVASMSGQLDYASATGRRVVAEAFLAAEAAAASTRLDTPERVRKDLQPTPQVQALSGRRERVRK